MRVPGRTAAVAALAASAVAAAACGGSPSSSRPAGGSPAGDPLAASSLAVFAAASLTEAFDEGATKLEAAHAGLAVTFSFAGSQALVTQIENGAPADVVATADTTTMQRLVAAGLVDAPRSFARNLLEIAVAPGNPRRVSGLDDLARAGLKVILADPSVPAGRYARQVLGARSVTVHPVSQPLDVKAGLLAVEQGDADAAIVYVTDVTAAGASVTGVPIPAAENAVATYPVAVVRSTQSRAAAAAFVADVVEGTVQRALAARGFLPP